MTQTLSCLKNNRTSVCHFDAVLHLRHLYHVVSGLAFFSHLLDSRFIVMLLFSVALSEFPTSGF